MIVIEMEVKMQKTKKLVIAIVVLLSLVLLRQIFPSNKNDALVETKDKLNTTEESIGTFTDERDQRMYRWVKIGEQTWMIDNLAYKPESGFSSYAQSNSNIDTYGYLYDWQTAQSIAPEGWHLPSKLEWETLNNYLGVHPGSQLKEKGTDHWQAPNIDATNTSRFTALPGGGNFDGEYLMMGRNGFFWSSTEIDETNAYGLIVENDSSGISWYSGTKVRELSVRCVKD